MVERLDEGTLPPEIGPLDYEGLYAVNFLEFWLLCANVAKYFFLTKLGSQWNVQFWLSALYPSACMVVCWVAQCY